MQLITDIHKVDRSAWNALAQTSATATWFQTPAAYDFFASLPELMTPFFFAVQEEQELKGVVVGYITREKNALKQFLTRRAIIIGGPMLSETIAPDALELLLNGVRKQLSSRAIYIETRNFNDYSAFRPTFEKCGFAYVPHYDFHIDTTSEEEAQTRIGKHRWKYIRLSIRDGASLVEKPTLEQVRQFYNVLLDLYQTKVKTPLFPWTFFERLYDVDSSRYLLVDYNGNIIGGSLCVCLENRGLYEWFVCGNDHFHKGIRPSSVATWFGMQFAAQNGYPLFDLMGAGRPDEPYGVRDFKAEFGGELKELGRFQYICKPLFYRIGSLGVKILKGR